MTNCVLFFFYLSPWQTGGSCGQDFVIVTLLANFKNSHSSASGKAATDFKERILVLVFAATVEDCGCLSGPPAKVVLAALLHH